MYGYEEYIDISPEQLLQKISQEEIFEWILEAKFDISSRYRSPFRVDRHPGCRFELRPDGGIVFVDFGERTNNPTKTHRSCFGMVMDYYRCKDIYQAIRLICSKFGLSSNSIDYTPVTSVNYSPVKNYTIDSPTRIHYQSIPYTKINIIYWSQFLIKVPELISDNVFSVKRFSVWKPEKGLRTINVYKHCYAIDFLAAKVEIYQPYSEKYRWISSCNENCIGNIDNLPATGKELIIKKSYKDHRVIRNLLPGTNVIWFINEGCVPSLEILKNLVDRFESIIVFFDADEDGVKAGLKLVAILNNLRENCARLVHLPVWINRHPNYKDPGEFVSKEGRKDTITVLNQIGIYGKDSPDNSS